MIVAVQAVVDVRRSRIVAERVRGLARVTVAVAVEVDVVDDRVNGVDVDLSVAVIVFAVAVLIGARIDTVVLIVAVFDVVVAVTVEVVADLVLAIAVLVDVVLTVVGCTGMHSALGVVAVLGVVRVPIRTIAGFRRTGSDSVVVAISVRVPGAGVGGVIVHAAIAVVVLVVTDLPGTGVLVRVAVIAVARGHAAGSFTDIVAVRVRRDYRARTTVAVAVLVPVAGLLVVTVLVDLITANLGGTGVDGCIGVITVLAVVVAVAIQVVARAALVVLTVAVLVDSVLTLFDGFRADVLVAVVAVVAVVDIVVGRAAGEHRAVRVAIVVAVLIRVPDHDVHGVIFVDEAVAVVVDLVAVLVGVGVDPFLSVIAVFHVGVAITVRILDRAALIGLIVAVVVGRGGAHLVGAGAGAGDRVVTVVVAADSVALGLVPIAVLVVVVIARAVAVRAVVPVLGRARVHVEGLKVGRVVVVPVRAIDTIRTAVDLDAVVAVTVLVVVAAAVAVLVDIVVPDLLGVGIDVRVVVVAVAIDLAVAVVVVVTVLGAVVDDAVAVVVEAISNLLPGGIRPLTAIAIEAVIVVIDVALGLRAGGDAILVVAEAITVRVRVPGRVVDRLFVDLAVAVVVHVIAQLVRIGVDGGIVVVAVVVATVPVAIGIGSDGGVQVVAVLVVVHVALRGLAGRRTVPRIVGVPVAVAVLVFARDAETIAITVLIPDGGIHCPDVDRSVAVIVDAVADLLGPFLVRVAADRNKNRHQCRHQGDK